MRFIYTVTLLLTYVTYSICADVKLCKDKNLKGECINVKVNKDQCIDLSKKKWASSINTNGACVRIYDKEKCQGKTIFVNSNSGNQNDLGKFDDKTVSIGLCFPQDSCTKKRSKRQTSNGYVCRWANEELTIGFLSHRQRDQNNLIGPVKYYQTNPKNGRTEVMEAVIEIKHLNKGSVTGDPARNYAHRMGRPDDDAGHILANRLGGSGTDLRNIFPQSKNFNRGVFARDVEGWVVRVVEQYGKAKYTINLVYNTDDDTRPVLLVYRILGGDNEVFIHQGDILNP